jgi:hypothetical protein
MRHVRLFLMLTFFTAAFRGDAQTLAKLLQSAGIPIESFSLVELGSTVNGSVTAGETYAYAIYRFVEGDRLIGNPYLVRYQKTDRELKRVELNPQGDDKERCCGAPNSVDVVDDYVALSFHMNPSANAVLVVDDKLKFVRSIYGFGLWEVAHDQIVYIEDMIHFAPVHPERLRFLDLRSGAARELYPPKGDWIRAAFTAKNRTLMAADKNCQRENSVCDPEAFDEDIRVIRGDATGEFALITALSALNAPPVGQEPDSLNTDFALYFYRQVAHGWLYCENEIPEEEATRLLQTREPKYTDLPSKCSPNLKVEEDASHNQYSAPFLRQSHQTK